MCPHKVWSKSHENISLKQSSTNLEKNNEKAGHGETFTFKIDFLDRRKLYPETMRNGTNNLF